MQEQEDIKPIATYIFSDDISDETVKTFADFLNSTIGVDKKIFFSTEGGYLAFADVMIELIDTYKDEIELVAFMTIQSAGMDILFKTKCKKRIMDSCVGMIHQVYTGFKVNESGSYVDDYEKFMAKVVKEDYRGKTLEFCDKIGLTSTEKNKVKKGRDLHITTSRLRELLKNFEK